MYSPLMRDLVKSLQVLPGVGPRTSQRMAFYLLERNRNGALRLIHALQSAIDSIGYCNLCRNLCEQSICYICCDEARQAELLCIVESPADVVAFEQSGSFKGRYFVLAGHLSPIDGVGPDDIGIKDLVIRVASSNIKEVILATNPTVEGEATAYYIAEQIKNLDVSVSRIAHGVPVGGELEYVDGCTLTHALEGRKSL